MREDYHEFEIGGYNIQREIGKGEFGKVYLARNRENMEVAIKTIKKADLSKSKKRQELFVTERSIMMKVSNENVVKLYQSLQNQDYHLLVMEYCNNGDLHYFIRNNLGGAMTEEQAIGALIQILNGFKGLHGLMVLHRDVKLKNIMVHNTTMKIADFGLSKMGDVATTVVGTPYTKAPEIFKKNKYNNKADIWSLGIIFYQMIFKLQYPFTAKTEQELFAKIIGGEKPNFEMGGIKISQACQDLLQSMLTIDPKKRINWKDISEHRAIVEHENRNQNKVSPKISSHSQYYEQIEQHMGTYEQFRLSINIYFTCLNNLITLVSRHPEFQRVNILYFQFLVCKQMRWNMTMLREALQKCMEISQVSDMIGKQELDDCANQVENYYIQSLVNLQLFLADREKSNPEIEKELSSYQPDPTVFQKFSCRLCEVLEMKLEVFCDAPNIQKLIIETVHNILMLFAPEYSESDAPETLDGMKKMVSRLRRKLSGH